MKSIKKNKLSTRRKLAIVIPSALVLLTCGALAFAYTADYWPFDQQSKSNNEAFVDTKEEYNDKNNQPSRTDNNQTDTSSEQTPQQPTPSEDKTVQTGNTVDQSGVPEVLNITRAEQSGSSIRVSAILSNASNGKCILSLEKTGQASIVKEAPVIIGPSYYTCSGFQIPRSELPTAGQWTAIVLHDINGKRSASERRVINVQ